MQIFMSLQRGRATTILLLCALAGCDARFPNAAAGALNDGDDLKAEGRAIDGDTISIDLRLLGADALERKQWCARGNGCWPCGKAAQDYAARTLKGATATIRFTGEQSYARPISTVSVRGRDLGESMIAAGYAVPAPEFLKRDPERARRYTAAFDTAAASRIGIHGGEFIEPRLWRKGSRLQGERDRGKG